MRLTPEEIRELTNHLVSTLKRKRFSVKTNHYGSILYAEKFGIRCCPAILNSTEDGKQSYAYIQLVVNPYSEKDLGSYYKPRTHKSTHQLFDKNDAVDKYAGKDNHIDMHNYNQVIETFVTDLNKDYFRIVRKTEDIDIGLDDTGTCEYKINPNSKLGWWYISADNYILKDAIVNCIKGLFDEYNVEKSCPENPGLSMFKEDVDDVFSPHVVSECSFSVSEPHYGYITVNTVSPRGAVLDKIAISGTCGAGDIGRVIDDWVKNHQDRLQDNLHEGLVKIKDTGTVFDGKTGVIEKDEGNKLVVLVDFNDEHKIRNRFKKEQIEILED